MEVNNENPTDINRFHLDEMLEMKVVLCKKRKLQGEQLSLPVPKHNCCARSYSSEPAYLIDGNPELEIVRTQIIKEKTKGAILDDAFEHKLAKDSNSFAEESDSAISVNEEAKLGTESADAYECDRCSTSSVNWGGDHLKGPHYFLDGLTMEKTVYDKEEFSFMSGEHYPSHDDPDIQALQNVEEHLLGFGNPSEYGNGKIEQCLHEEFEEILCSKGVNPNMYVLSSGRWTADEEAQSGTRKPTIDQEFEQHFSMLML